MVRALSFAFAAVVCASAVVASWEPLEADNLFAREPASFEPIEAPSATRRELDFAAAPAHNKYFPRTHALMTRGYNAQHAQALSNSISSINTVVKGSHATILNACSSAKKSSNPTKVIKSVQPELAKCKKVIHEACGSIPHIPHKPHPSGHPGSGGSPPSCAGLIAELIELLDEIVAELEKLISEIPALAALLEGYVESIDAELAELVHSSNTVVPEVQSFVSKFVSNIESDLKSHGFGSLINELHL